MLRARRSAGERRGVDLSRHRQKYRTPLYGGDALIPGTTKLHLDENLGAVAVELTRDDLREIDESAGRIAVRGARYSESSQRMIDR